MRHEAAITSPAVSIGELLVIVADEIELGDQLEIVTTTRPQLATILAYQPAAMIIETDDGPRFQCAPYRKDEGRLPGDTGKMHYWTVSGPLRHTELRQFN